MKRLALLLMLVVAPVATAGAAGSWRLLPKAPIAPNDGGLASVWTGRQMVVFGRAAKKGPGGATSDRVNVAATYDPARNVWRRLSPPKPTPSFMDNDAVWTGKEVLVWGQGTRLAYNPRTNRWRRLPGSPLLSIHDGYGIVAWTGRELIGWGGGCCGDAFSDGVAYNPKTNRWRALAPTPLAGGHALGAWTGRELVLFVGNLNPDTGKPWPARLARAAAYNPATDTWRRIAPLPAPRGGANAVWDGREILVVGGAAGRTAARVGFAYNPATNRWRRLPPMDSGRIGAAAVWTGSRLLLWGGTTSPGSSAVPRRGLAYDPRTNSWSRLPQAPLAGSAQPVAVWTGHSMIVWGGTKFAGAAFTTGRRAS
jgi:N-acetylneuraminic acid mutarotase